MTQPPPGQPSQNSSSSRSLLSFLSLSSQYFFNIWCLSILPLLLKHRVPSPCSRTTILTPVSLGQLGWLQSYPVCINIARVDFLKLSCQGTYSPPYSCSNSATDVPRRAIGQTSRLQRERHTEERTEAANPNISPDFSKALLPLSQKCYNVVLKNGGSEVRKPASPSVTLGIKLLTPLSFCFLTEKVRIRVTLSTDSWECPDCMREALRSQPDTNETSQKRSWSHNQDILLN